MNTSFGGDAGEEWSHLERPTRVSLPRKQGRRKETPVSVIVDGDEVSPNSCSRRKSTTSLESVHFLCRKRSDTSRKASL